MRKQSKFDVEERAFANAADDGGHAIAGIDVATRLGAIFIVENDNGISQTSRKRGQLCVHLEIAEGFADFVERGDFFQADGDAFEVAVDNRNAIAVGAEADAGFDEARAIPLAEQLLWLSF